MHDFLIIVAASSLLAIPAQAADTDGWYASQRAAFRVAYPAAQRGDVETVTPYLEEIIDYPLYPDLLGALLRGSLARQPHTALDAFRAKYPTHPEAHLLARAQLRQAADRNEWSKFLRLWEAAPQRDAEMACHLVAAQINTGANTRSDSAGLKLWHVGHSQPTACDPVFVSLKQRNLLTKARYWQRLDLALEERQFGLASYLARSLDKSAQQRVGTWQQMLADPASTLDQQVNHSAAAKPSVALLEAGLMRLAYRDGGRALALWRKLAKRYELPTDLRARLLRQAALGSAQRLETNAVKKLAQVPPNLVDDKVRHWRVRSALRDNNPTAALRALDGLSDNQAALAGNRYWRARILDQLGDSDQSQQTFAGVAEERGFYGFLAADWLQLPYAFGHTPTPMDATRLSALAADHQFIRARELFHVGLFGRGRQLWERLMKTLDQTDQSQAALLANRWGWHSRAIATASRAGLRHDLRLRFPIPQADWLNNLPVDQSLVLGVARSESSFMPDVRSSAGAVGLMQLMPATGKEVARKLGVNYRGLKTLVDPVSNARLGSEYLNRMLQRFDENKVLAAAAYNAGPHRVDQWLPTTEMPAEIWLATIPFQETRQYVQRVLETATIMQWRMGGAPQRRLTDALRPVRPPEASPPIAQAR